MKINILNLALIFKSVNYSNSINNLLNDFYSNFRRNLRDSFTVYCIFFAKETENNNQNIPDNDDTLFGNFDESTNKTNLTLLVSNVEERNSYNINSFFESQNEFKKKNNYMDDNNDLLLKLNFSDSNLQFLIQFFRILLVYSTIFLRFK